MTKVKMVQVITHKIKTVFVNNNVNKIQMFTEMVYFDANSLN